jgi:hypothetical protein
VTDVWLYGPQVAAVVTGLAAAVAGTPRDLPRLFGVGTALVGVVGLVAMDRWLAAGCTDDGCSGAAFSITWIGYWVSWILPLVIISASIPDLIGFLHQRRRANDG